MNNQSGGSRSGSLKPEKVAYWYFRLNGFLQIENFVVHPARHGSQRTDADLLAVRFPHRQERLVDNRDDIMVDDAQALALSGDLIDVLIAEVKTNEPCSLNGPWTDPGQRNVDRVLAAIGCLTPDRIEKAASEIYSSGKHVSGDGLQIRLVAVGRERNDGLEARYPHIMQLVWNDICTFIWRRFYEYRRQKTQVDQWDETGQCIKALADGSHDTDAFARTMFDLMGVRWNDQRATVRVASQLGGQAKDG